MYLGTMLFPAVPEVVRKVIAAVNDLYGPKQTSKGPQTKAQGKIMCLFGFAKPPPAEGKTMILMNTVFDGPEDEAKKLLQPFFDIGPVFNDMRMDEYPIANKLVPAIIGMRSSMKGAAFVMPIREQLVFDIQSAYDQFLEFCQDAAPSIVAWELYDPCTVAANEQGSFANRGYHFNSLVMPLWSDAANDQRCRQFARDVSNMFKKEIESHGEQSSAGIEGGASVRGKKGAVMLYGNYDVRSRPFCILKAWLTV